MDTSHETRIKRSLVALDGLSTGDAFGDRWFSTPIEITPGLMEMRALPAPVWVYTDDTQMALSIVETLRLHKQIDQDYLAMSFAKRYEPLRKYGASMRGLFLQILDGVQWRQAASGLFDGQGSFGNGAAMRVAPVGAYFADDLSKAAEQGRLSSEITHAHSEGIAGGVAVAVATAVAWQTKGNPLKREEFLAHILPYIPEGEVKFKTQRAQTITNFRDAVLQLGNGMQISAQDTVPLCLWLAGEYLSNYEDALWTTARAGGDIDTNCAIVGGIVGSYVGAENIPADWLSSREPLPSWATG